ncbi:MAG TPA: lipid II flippase MurJ, partial [Gammaproteobacteria bacterium]
MAVTAGDARRARRGARVETVSGALPRSGGEFRSTATMSVLRMAGKLLGMLKTLVIAALFGASASLDAFWIAYSMPLILPGMIRGVVATAFIPGFMRSSLAGGREIDWRGLNTLFTLVTVALVVLCVLVAVFRGGIVSVMAPGLAPETHALAATLTGMMSVAVLVFGVNAMLSAILQALNRFVVMSLESIVTNIVIIAGCVF